MNSNNLANRIVNYLRHEDLYDYKDIYNQDEEAYNDIDKLLSDKDGIISIIEKLCFDIHDFVLEKDLSNLEIKTLINEALSLINALNLHLQQLKNVKKWDKNE